MKYISLIIFLISPIGGLIIANATEYSGGMFTSLFNGIYFWGISCLIGTAIGALSIKKHASSLAYTATALNCVISALFLIFVIALWIDNERSYATSTVTLSPAIDNIIIDVAPAWEWDRPAYGSKYLTGFYYSLKFPDGPAYELTNVKGTYSLCKGRKSITDDTPLKIIKYGKAPGCSQNYFNVFVGPTDSLNANGRLLDGIYMLKCEFDYNQHYVCTAHIDLRYSYKFPLPWLD